MKNITNKKEFRAQALIRLRKDHYYRYQASKKVSKVVERLIAYHDPQRVLFYLPMAHEIDLRALLAKERKKREVYVPFMLGDSFKMVRYSLPLKRAALGILEAKNSIRSINKVDMIIVPILGVDRDYKRIGFGKGMYDRFVERLDNKALLLFVQQKHLQTRHTITDHYDIQADYIITPKKFLTIKA